MVESRNLHLSYYCVFIHLLHVSFSASKLFTLSEAPHVSAWNNSGSCHVDRQQWIDYMLRCGGSHLWWFVTSARIKFWSDWQILTRKDMINAAEFAACWMPQTVYINMVLGCHFGLRLSNSSNYTKGGVGSKSRYFTIIKRGSEYYDNNIFDLFKYYNEYD